MQHPVRGGIPCSTGNGSEKQFGIYQITERDPEHDYRFIGLDYVEKKGITVTRADYDLIY